MLKEYHNLARKGGVQGDEHRVHQVCARSDREAVMDPAGAEGGETTKNDDDEDEPAETAACAFGANNLHKGSNLGT